MYLCEQCGKEVYEKYGSGRFCSRSCSNKYVALHQSDEAKAKKVEAGKKNLKHLGSESHEFSYDDRIKGLRKQVEIRRINRKKKLDIMLSNPSDPYHGGYARFRDMLIEFGYKKRICECCMNTEWMGKPVPIELHHIDGNRYNNLLDNIQFLCPNCHAQTPNFSWRKVSKSKEG